MNIDELIARLATDAQSRIPPQPAEFLEPFAALQTDEPAFAWLIAGPAQDAILWPTRVFPGL